MEQDNRELIKVLVVDDDPDICTTLKGLFKKKGYYVATAGTGGEALERMKETLYHFAIIDIRLPDMTGIELLEELRKTNFKTNCIMMTGHKEEDPGLSLEKGAKAHFLKPLKVEEVIQIFEKEMTAKK